jgi:50S ribosomal protein L16 3-hydroxylase
LARELLMGLADEAFEGLGESLYKDPRQTAVATPAAIPTSLAGFARQVVDKALKTPDLLDSLLGEYLTEPKAHVWFDEAQTEPDLSTGVQLDRRTKMMYDDRHVFINGESFRVGGRDARFLRQLADNRYLPAPSCAQLSLAAQEALLDWMSADWLKPAQDFPEPRGV